MSPDKDGFALAMIRVTVRQKSRPECRNVGSRLGEVYDDIFFIQHDGSYHISQHVVPSPVLLFQC